MHDPFLMRRGQSLGELPGVIDGATHRQRTCREHFAQRLPFQQLADDVDLAVVLSELVNRQQIRIIGAPGGARPLLEARQPLGIGNEIRRQNFDRHVAAEARVARAVNLAHPSGTEQRGDLARSESCAWRDRHEVTIIAGCRYAPRNFTDSVISNCATGSSPSFFGTRAVTWTIVSSRSFESMARRTSA